MPKPRDVFDRDQEWADLAGFVDQPRAGAALGLVYGRRRQGKTYLLQALAEAGQGVYVAALRQSAEQNLQRLSDAYRETVGSPARVAFESWEAALRSLLQVGQDSSRPAVVVLDEFPYLLSGAPELASILQSLLSPRGPAARGWRTRLILCGSALSTMRGLLTGSAPLRGRASLELVVRPFGYRAAASYWGLGADPDLALRLHALVGGTPAYLDMCGGLGPDPGRDQDLDRWVVRTLLNPASAMFREGDVLLAEEEGIADPSTYWSVLSAVSQGRTRRSEIAAAIGRPQTAVAHPLSVLTATGLIAPVEDAVRSKRATFRVAEPVLRLHQLVIAPNQARLARHRGEQVWTSLADTVSSRIYGPHFEDVAREWCSAWAGPDTLGGIPGRVAPTQVACAEHRGGHELDVVVLAADPPSRILAIGEAKWRSRPCGPDQLGRLEHLRDLLGLEPGARLLLFSRKGFEAAVRRAAVGRHDVRLIDLERLYTGE
jgi:AAA+ ATPase superfamily predicted ATPase